MGKIAKQISSLKKIEIDKIFKTAEFRIRTEYFNLLLASRGLDFARLLIIIPKKYGTAPERNLIRRRLKAIFYEEKLFNLPYDCIIIIKEKSKNLKFSELKEIFVSIIKTKQSN